MSRNNARSFDGRREVLHWVRPGLLPLGTGRRGRGMVWAVLAAVLLGLGPGTATAAEALKRHFRPLYATFGDNSTTQIDVLSGPENVKMNRGGAAGKQWIVRSGEYRFKVTIEIATRVDVGTLIDRLERLPAPYMRACKEVSDPKEDGIAVYADLGGAAAHGGKAYINLAPHANALVIAHEAGHCLEQVATKNDPTIPTQWQEAIAADKISVSDYGDNNWWEDAAEFAQVYAVCRDAGPGPLGELKKLSPRRFALWENILLYRPSEEGD